MTQETPKKWFWEVRGRTLAPEWLKYLGITAVFTRRRKGAIFLQFLEFPMNPWISANFIENHKNKRNYTKHQKITVFHKSATLHETFVFPRPNAWSRAMGPPKPGNTMNSTKFSGIPLFEWNYAEFW